MKSAVCTRAQTIPCPAGPERSDDDAFTQQDGCLQRPVRAEGVDRILPAGAYWVVTDEELIEGISFPVYRRVATMIFVPGRAHGASSVEMVPIDPRDLQAALERDAVP